MTPFCSSWLQAAWTGLIEDHDFICLCLRIFNGLHPLRKHPPVTGLFPWEQSSFFRLCDGTSQEYSRRPDESNFCWVKDCGSAPAPIYTNVQGLVQRTRKLFVILADPCPWAQHVANDEASPTTHCEPSPWEIGSNELPPYLSKQRGLNSCKYQL